MSRPGLLADDDAAAGRTARWADRRRGEDAPASGPELVDACHALAASGVPDSLEHGDLAADEVILGEMGPVFLDWSDGSITHPFLSAASLLRPVGRRPRTQDALVAAYLGPWLRAGIGHAADGRAAARPGAHRPAAPPRRAVRGTGPARARQPTRWADVGARALADPPAR